ncbi:hypothetical protein JKG47_06375 [Acidithiobacillus sp. MC6.1]|nr:hypothetical protein [Acidithiobacillus sp. MC6.1]
MMLPEPVLHLLRDYTSGNLSAAETVWEIQRLGLPGFEAPTISEVIHWSIESGLGGPWPTEKEAREQARMAIRH